VDTAAGAVLGELDDDDPDEPDDPDELAADEPAAGVLFAVGLMEPPEQPLSIMQTPVQTAATAAAGAAARNCDMSCLPWWTRLATGARQVRPARTR
jgi:hypothetical protein